MLIDRSTNETYSSRSAAIRSLGEALFFKKVKNNEIEYIEVK